MSFADDQTASTNPDGLDRSTLIKALQELWDSLAQLLAGLTPQEWARDTCLPGWTVSDVVAHIIGTEAMLAGDPMPAVATDVSTLPHVANDIAAVNEVWVESLRGTPPAKMLATFREIAARRTDALERTTQEDFDAPSWTPVGRATFGRFMQIRVYDTWMHEQDIRAAVGVPGHHDGSAAQISLAELTLALGYIIGKRAGVPDGASVLFDLSRGPLPAQLAVAVQGKAKLVTELGAPPTVTLRMPTPLLLWLSGGRAAAAEHSADIEVDGDADLGRRVLDNLAFTM